MLAGVNRSKDPKNGSKCASTYMVTVSAVPAECVAS
jgi:hypothetical protein